MLEALARRERGTGAGAVVRGVVLALRLELTAAVASLGPELDRNPVARGVLETLVAPRGKPELVSGLVHAPWIEHVDPELAAVLASFAAALGPPEDATRGLERLRSAEERLRDGGLSPPSVGATLQIARLVLEAATGARAVSSSVRECLALTSKDVPPPPLLHRLLQAALVGTLARSSEPPAIAELERAAILATEVRMALLEACVLVDLGRLYTRSPATREAGLGWLVRVRALVAHGEAPTLEHASLHEQGSTALAQGRFGVAAAHYQSARRIAAACRLHDASILSCALEALALLAAGDRAAASSCAEELVDARLLAAGAPATALALVLRALLALTGDDVARARSEIERASRVARSAPRAEDARSFVAIVAALLDEIAEGSLEPLAVALEAHPSEAARSLSVLRAIAVHARSEPLRLSLEAAVERALALAGPVSTAEHPTDAPPPP